ncbi:hypothetical protein SCLCIDRAFT_1072830 [Scleroderma citrinum Foug A]|uniref:Uncharacterized protein n=1 Tax=Scleroderma citrinum Foug A TaxID=1036808 RepID=A0A0C3ASD6_9AGAM|nr:hypothetical protein SCLCIDRAFT_1072830 [Scleroderma citrinum Foug A]
MRISWGVYRTLPGMATDHEAWKLSVPCLIRSMRIERPISTIVLQPWNGRVGKCFSVSRHVPIGVPLIIGNALEAEKIRWTPYPSLSGRVISSTSLVGMHAITTSNYSKPQHSISSGRKTFR